MKTQKQNKNYITLDLTKSNDIKKGIFLIEQGYKIINYGIYLITLKK